MKFFYSLFFSALTFTILFSGTHAVKLFIKNNCPNIIWPAILTSGTTQLSNNGFRLGSGLITAINVPAPWTGRVWARTGCSNNDSGKLICNTGDCGSGLAACNGAVGSSPVSLAEFTLAANGQDFYDISLVDGFNLPVSIDLPTSGDGGILRYHSQEGQRSSRKHPGYWSPGNQGW